jgi:hypothetical protein
VGGVWRTRDEGTCLAITPVRIASFELAIGASRGGRLGHKSAIVTRLTAVAWIIAVGASVLAGALLPLAPTLAAAPLAALAVVALTLRSVVRVLVVVFGGLVVLQTSQTLDAPKIAYLAAVSIAFAAALPHALQELRGSGRSAKGLVIAGAAFGAMTALSFPVSLSRGDDLTTWVRGAAPFFLFATAPVFALDAAASVPRRWLGALLLVAGALATASYAVEWIGRRGLLSQLLVDRIVLPSIMLPAALFAMAIAVTLGTHRLRPLWAGLAGIVLLTMLLTGSRTNLVLLAALPSVYLAARGGVSARAIRLALTSVVIVALTGVGLLFVGELGGFAGGTVQTRLASVATILSDPASDASYVDRAAQTAAAYNDWAKSPLLGTGPAHQVVWTGADGSSRLTLVIDSPLLYPMQFGLLGIVLLVSALLAWIGFIRATTDPVARATLAGTWGVSVALSILVSPLEDKGFTFALLLALAFALAPSTSRRSYAQHLGGATTGAHLSPPRRMAEQHFPRTQGDSDRGIGHH